MATRGTAEATTTISEGMTPEPLADIAEALAEMATPEHRAELAWVRAAVEVEFPPIRPDPMRAESLAGLKLAREAKGLSLDEVSLRSGLDREAIARIERGAGNPTLSTVGRLMKAIGVRPSLTFEDAG